MKKQKHLWAFRITMIYLAIGILWILLTDTVLFTFINDAQKLSSAQTYKGWFYIGVTSLLLLFLLRINEKNINNTKTRVQEEYRELVERLPGVVFMDIYNDPQTTQYMSPRIKDLVGYTADEWKSGENIWENSLHPDDKERVINEDKRTNEVGETFRIEYRLRHKDGHYVWIKEDASLIKGKDGTPLFW